LKTTLVEDPLKPKADGPETIPVEDPQKPKGDGLETTPAKDPPNPKADGSETTPVEEHPKSEADSVKSQANSTASSSAAAGDLKLKDLEPKDLWARAYEKLLKKNEKNEKLVDHYARFLQYPDQQGTIIMIGFSNSKDFGNFLLPRRCRLKSSISSAQF
jgi:hypothetical protein